MWVSMPASRTCFLPLASSRRANSGCPQALKQVLASGCRPSSSSAKLGNGRSQALGVLLQPEDRKLEGSSPLHEDAQVAVELLLFVHEGGELALDVDDRQRGIGKPQASRIPPSACALFISSRRLFGASSIGSRFPLLRISSRSVLYPNRRLPAALPNDAVPLDGYSRVAGMGRPASKPRESRGESHRRVVFSVELSFQMYPVEPSGITGQVRCQWMYWSPETASSSTSTPSPGRSRSSRYPSFAR